MPDRSIKRRLQRCREFALYVLLTPMRWLFNVWMRRKNYVLLYCTIGDGIGDALALSTLLRTLNQQKGCRGIIFSMYPQIFWHNPLVACNIGYHDCSSLARSLLKTFCRAMRGDCAICFGGEVWTLGTSPFTTKELDDGRKPGWIWLTHMVPDNNVILNPATAIPQIVFSAEEQRQFTEKFSHLPDDFALLKATVGVDRHGAATLKNWDLDRVAAVIKATPALNWIQVGQSGEPEIPGAQNLLGKTSLREVLFLLSRARLILSVEGFLTHASAAFGIPCVVPFTGIHEPHGLLYPNTLAVEPVPRPACMPCWSQTCTTAGMPCRNNISQEQVIMSLHKAWSMPRDIQ